MISLMIRRFLPLFVTFVYVLAVTVGTFTGGLWAIAGIGGSLLIYAGTGFVQKKPPPLDSNLVLFVVLFFIVVALLNGQAFSPGVSWHFLLQQLSIIVPLVLLSSSTVQGHLYSRHFFPILVAATCAGALSLGIEFALGAPLLHLVKGVNASITEYNRGVSYLMGMTLPLVAYLWLSNRRWEAIIFVAFLFIPASLTESRATKMALILGILTMGGAQFSPLLVRYVLTLFLFSLLLLPFVVTDIFLHHPTWTSCLPASWQHRTEIWDYMSYRIFDRPWLGWGIGSSHLLTYQYPHGADYIFVKQGAGHPHNVIIQLWVELGIPGLILGFSFALLMLQRASKLPAKFVPYALGTWMTILSISLVGYNFWNDSFFAFIAMTVFLYKLLVHEDLTYGFVQKQKMP